MCGIIALLLADTEALCNQELSDGLTALQHRGQDAAGMVTSSSSQATTKFHLHKGAGLVREVFTLQAMQKLTGNSGIAHVRYPTAGEMTLEEIQPLYVNYPCGLALGHNGNLTNYAELSDWVRLQHRHLNSSSDSEVLLNVFGENLRNQLDCREGQRSAKITPKMIMEAVRLTMRQCRGGYSVVMLIHDIGVVAFRDPYGIRPLSYGTRFSSTLDGGIDYAFASESVAFDILGFDLIRDVKPGECLLAVPMVPGHPRENLGLYAEQLYFPSEVTAIPTYPCLFEYVYLARPDSVMNGVSVYQARLNMGEKLALKIKGMFKNYKDIIDCVIPIPETSRNAALRCAQILELPYCEGFIKNRYIARTFIMPGQAVRNKSIRLKLNTIKSEFEGKNVLLVDDSVVRGNTSKQLIAMAKEAGAESVYFASTAPEIKHPNVYGIDLPTHGELIAFSKTNDEIARILGCEKMIYQDLWDLETAVTEAKISETEGMEIVGFEGSTFTGKYLTDDVDEKYFARMVSFRSDEAKSKMNGH